MRSYYSHLKTTTQNKSGPVLRSSALFPVFSDALTSTRFIFLGYWLLKRRIAHIRSVVTIRDRKGKMLHEHSFLILEPKAYEIDIKKIIPSYFLGSAEIEFHSDQDLVFPYPAISVNYYGEHFSTVVHTAERTYNNPEDEEKNSETSVPESGFNLYAQNNLSSFITLINGKEETPAQNLQLDFYNRHDEKLPMCLELPPFSPYEIQMIDLDLPELSSFLKGEAGTCKMKFSLKNVFPRLLVGNRLKTPFAKVITHTYYDCSKAITPSNFWNPQDEDWYAASLMLPLLTKNHTTTLSFYPIFSPSSFALDLEIYNSEGTLLKKQNDLYHFPAGFDQFVQIPLHTFYSNERPLAARIIVRPLSDTPVPARIKIAVDIGVQNKGLPCNICTNVHLYVPEFKEKKASFKWAPLLADQPHSFAFIMNSSPEKKLDTAEVQLTFYRSQDTQTLKRLLTLEPNGFYKIDLSEDAELAAFFNKKVGWFTAICTNPYTTLYYFAENPSGVIGGDHGF